MSLRRARARLSAATSASTPAPAVGSRLALEEVALVAGDKVLVEHALDHTCRPGPAAGAGGMRLAGAQRLRFIHLAQ
jgi:hypothetical protein